MILYPGQTVILEDESEYLTKIVPDMHGGYNLFYRINNEWDWDDSIGDDSREARIKYAKNIYLHVIR